MILFVLFCYAGDVVFSWIATFVMCFLIYHCFIMYIMHWFCDLLFLKCSVKKQKKSGAFFFSFFAVHVWFCTYFVSSVWFLVHALVELVHGLCRLSVCILQFVGYDTCFVFIFLEHIYTQNSGQGICTMSQFCSSGFQSLAQDTGSQLPCLSVAVYHLAFVLELTHCSLANQVKNKKYIMRRLKKNQKVILHRKNDT